MNTITVQKNKTSPFTVRLNKATKIKLEKEAQAQDRSVSYIVQQVLENLVEDLEYKRQIITEAYENSLSETSFVSGEKVDKWVESWGSKKPLKMPKADIFYK